MTEDELYSIAWKVARSFCAQTQHRYEPEEVLGAAWVGAVESLDKARNMVGERGGGLSAYVRVSAWRACKVWMSNTKDGGRRETHLRKTKGTAQARFTDCREDYEGAAECTGLRAVDMRDELAFLCRNLSDFDIEILCGTFAYGLSLVEFSQALGRSEYTIRQRRQRKLQRVRRDLRLSQLWKLWYVELVDDDTIAGWEELEQSMIRRERLNRNPTPLELAIPDQQDVQQRYDAAMQHARVRGVRQRMGNPKKRAKERKRQRRLVTT